MKDCINKKSENKFDEYINNLIGSVDYSKFKDCDLNYINEIDKSRINQARYTINSIITGIPKEKISYIYTKETRGFSSVEELDILDIEIILNSSVLTINKIIKNKISLVAKRCGDEGLCSKDISQFIKNQLIIYTTDIYNSELDRLIREKEELISNLLETNQPTINKSSEIIDLQSAYCKKYKTSC